MTLTLVRVDDRLIHGQVVAVWLRAVGADRIVIVDDPTARDEFLRTVLTLAAPEGVPVEVLGLAAGAVRVAALAAAPERTLVLLRSPLTALALRRAGVEFELLNVGGIGAGPGRRLVHRSVSASPDELAALRELERLGTRVELRALVDDRPVAFSAIDPGPR
jgi:mannose/fructose/N-acetylgalactosamine-specific phosphotransferase system component IIB